MASATITISGLTDITGLAGPDKASALRDLRNVLQGVAAGAFTATLLDIRSSATNAVRASGTLTCGTANATATINGVGSIAGNGADAAARAVDLAANINASTDPLVLGHVTAAVTSSGVVTVTAKTPGVSGNAITIAITGTGSSASGARLASGAGGDGVPVTISL